VAASIKVAAQMELQDRCANTRISLIGLLVLRWISIYTDSPYPYHLSGYYGQRLIQWGRGL